jgi:Mg-chelatase subunit ChlD
LFKKIGETGDGVQFTAEMGKDELLLVSVIPPKKGERVACDVCCVIDVSGSMNDEATLKGTGGDVESYGFSILDIVKHAVRTIIEVLGPDDRLALVTFSDTSSVHLQLTEMNDSGKKKANATLDTFKPAGSTNLWAGVNSGLETLKGSNRQNTAVFLLTDGEPNIHPPRGEVETLKYHKSKYGLTTSIHTFGFGYKLNSTMLDQLAVEGNGSYAFIPDSSFTGTIFVHALSNTLTTLATNVTVSIQTDKPNVGKFLGTYPQEQNENLIHMGSLKYGQRKDAVFRLTTPLPENSTITLNYKSTITGKDESVKITSTTPTGHPEALVQSFRLRLTEILKNLKDKNIQEYLNQLTKEILSSEVSDSIYIQDLVKDITGQITEALSSDANFNRWGRHFLPSLSRAHLIQQCNNFKDPGVQHYGGELFTSIRDTADEIFCKLPPPTPSRGKTTYVAATPNVTSTSTSSYSYAATPTTTSSYNAPAKKSAKKKTKTHNFNMATYHNAYGGCILSDCNVLMADNSLKKVKDISKNDQVKTTNGESAQVLCITKTTLNPTKTPLVKLNTGLILTPWHPVYISKTWQFPSNIGETWETTSTSEDVFNFVLDKGHVMIINDMACVTLGHGFTEDVVKHKYFGTQEVINDLKNMHGWQEGKINLNSVTVKRDTQSGEVSAYVTDR